MNQTELRKKYEEYLIDNKEFNADLWQREEEAGMSHMGSVEPYTYEEWLHNEEMTDEESVAEYYKTEEEDRENERQYRSKPLEDRYKDYLEEGRRLSIELQEDVEPASYEEWLLTEEEGDRKFEAKEEGVAPGVKRMAELCEEYWNNRHPDRSPSPVEEQMLVDQFLEVSLAMETDPDSPKTFRLMDDFKNDWIR